MPVVRRLRRRPQRPSDDYYDYSSYNDNSNRTESSDDWQPETPDGAVPKPQSTGGAAVHDPSNGNRSMFFVPGSAGRPTAPDSPCAYSLYMASLTGAQWANASRPI
ncbi:hypothetical protein DTO021C3_2217 [Paecilomyces variotii]|nr:hypothetical protein DTO021C3_2217 [Paecilomyces variotii]